MDYPFLYHGKRAGTLTVSADGLFTVFSISAELCCDRLLRASVYGGGEEYCLGVLEPCSGKYTLTRRFTRTAMAELPRTIEYAAPAGEKPEAKPESAVGSEWRRYSDGTLLRCDGKMIAIPAQLRTPTAGVVLKSIEGKTYILFYT